MGLKCTPLCLGGRMGWEVHILVFGRQDGAETALTHGWEAGWGRNGSPLCIGGRMGLKLLTLLWEAGWAG